MKVGQVARAAGVSVRTLHHWEQVGLVAPSSRLSNGYRLYDKADLRRVQSVVAWRELGLSLEDIRVLVEQGATTELLEQHRDLLRTEAERIERMTAAVERAVEARRMGIELDPAELGEVFGDEDPTEHAQEAADRWGRTDAYAQSHRRTSVYSKDDWARMRAEQEDLEQRMAAAMGAGETGVDLALEHRALITRWFYDCSAELHVQLSEIYVADERFTAHFDDRAPGLAVWLRKAIVTAAG